MYFAILAKIFHILHFYTKYPFHNVLTDECDGIFFMRILNIIMGWKHELSVFGTKKEGQGFLPVPSVSYFIRISPTVNR